MQGQKTTEIDDEHEWRLLGDFQIGDYIRRFSLDLPIVSVEHKGSRSIVKFRNITAEGPSINGQRVESNDIRKIMGYSDVSHIARKRNAGKPPIYPTELQLKKRITAIDTQHVYLYVIVVGEGEFAVHRAYVVRADNLEESKQIVRSYSGSIELPAWIRSQHEAASIVQYDLTELVKHASIIELKLS